jgi:HK97 family phage major capsid protein
MSLQLELQKAIEKLEASLVKRVEELEAKKGTSPEDIQTAVAELKTHFDEQIAEINKKFEASNLGLPGIEEDKDKFSFARALVGIHTGDWRGAGFEKEQFDNMREKAAHNSNATGVAGAFLVAQELSSQIIDLAIAKMPIFQMGVTQLNGLVGDLAIPKITARPTGRAVAENAQPTGSGITTDLRYLRPKRMAEYTKLSMQLLRQSDATIEQIVKEQLAKAVRLKWHRTLIDGLGASNEIKGIIRDSGLSTTTAISANGGRLLLDKCAEMAKVIDVANMLDDAGSVGWLMHPTVKWGLKRQQVAQYSGDTEGAPILVNSPIMSDAQLESTLGYMVRSTTDISTTNSKGSSTTLSDVIFGDWKQVWIGTWQGMELKTSNVASDGTDNAFTQDLLFVLAQIQTDMTLADETGLTRLDDAEITEANW